MQMIAILIINIGIYKEKKIIKRRLTTFVRTREVFAKKKLNYSKNPKNS